MPGAALLIAAALAFGADPQAPVLVHDAAETSPASRVARDLPGAVAYRRTTGRYVQFWLWFDDNPQDRGIVRTGRHAGDWELLQLRLDARGRPDEVVVGQHSGAERCPGSRLARRDGHPVLWVANGSHALYLRRGVRDRPFPDPNDEARGGGVVRRPVVQPITARSPAWMRSSGRWGATRKRGWIPYESDSPRGPAFQPGRWDDPEAFARSAGPCRARCDREDECDGREVALGGGAAATGLLGLLLLGAVGRRRGR